MNDQDRADALILQQGGADIVAILLETVMAAPESQGRSPDPVDLIECVGVFLSAAWQLAKLADDDSDGGRAKRYADFVRRHADAVEFETD